MNRYTGAAVGVLLAANAAALAGAAWNRSGEAQAVLTLTERELPREPSPEWRESSGVTLRLDTHHWFKFEHRPRPSSGLDDAALASLGFDVRLPEDREEAARLVRRQSARRGWVAIEVDGPAAAEWQRALEEELAAAEQAAQARGGDAQWLRRAVEESLRSGSRLFVVDAGSDAAALRAKHPDRTRVAVVQARISVALHEGDSVVWERHRREPVVLATCQPPRCHIAASVELLPDKVDVPARLQPSLAAIPPQPSARVRPPAYQVKVAFGRRGEPWIQEIGPLAPAP